MLTTQISDELKLSLVNAVNNSYNECYEVEQLTQLYLYSDCAELYFGNTCLAIYYELRY